MVMVTKMKEQVEWNAKEYQRQEKFYYEIQNSSSYTFEQKEKYRIEWERSKIEWESSKTSYTESETRLTEQNKKVEETKKIQEKDMEEFERFVFCFLVVLLVIILRKRD